MLRLFACVALAIVALPSASRCQQPVQGAFATLDSMPTADDLRQARDDGLNLIILQYTQSTFEAPSVDAVVAFIDTAEAIGIGYMIGLRYHESWDSTWQPGGVDFDSIIQSNRQVMRVLQSRLQGRTLPRFRGWYVPLEVANVAWDDSLYVRLAASFQQVTAGIRDPVALSIYFNPHDDFLRAAEFAAAIQPVLRNFDIVILQDGVGTRRIDEFREELDPYYTAIRDVVDSTPGLRVWADVEAFDCEALVGNRQCKEPLRPADDSVRLCRQVAAARKVTDDIVVFRLGGPILQPLRQGWGKTIYRAFIHSLTSSRCRPPRRRSR